MQQLSIITVNLNNADGLEKTILSVINQTDQNFQFVVIDGGSHDDSLEVITKHKNRIDIVISEKDSGVYAAMNKGIRVCNGEYIYFLNSGDHFYDSEALKKMRYNLGFEDLIYFKIEKKNDVSTKIVNYPEELRFSDFYIGGICHQAVLIKKNLFHKVGYYDEDLKIAADWKFFILALFKFNCTSKRIDVLVTTYYLGGLSSQYSDLEEREQVLRNDFQRFVEDYDNFIYYRKIMHSNRFRALEIAEKSNFGKKMMSLVLRVYLIIFHNSGYRKIYNDK